MLGTEKVLSKKKNKRIPCPLEVSIWRIQRKKLFSSESAILKDSGGFGKRSWELTLFSGVAQPAWQRFQLGEVELSLLILHECANTGGEILQVKLISMYSCAWWMYKI